MEVTVALSLTAGAGLVEEEPAGTLALRTPPAMHRPPIKLAGTPAVRAALRRLEAPGAPLTTLAVDVLSADGPAGFPELQRAVGLLDRCAVLSRTLLVDGVALASLDPASLYYRHQDGRVDAATRYRLSRFALVRREASGLILESPLGHARIRFHAPGAVAAVGALAEARTAAELAEAGHDLDEAAALAFLDLLADAEALVPVRDGAAPAEDADPVLAQWDFHDLLFHSRSRLGRHAEPYGGTFRFKDRFDPLPVVKPAMSGDGVALPRPDLARLAVADRPFSAVLEGRRSQRRHGPEPLSLDQLGEFLFRSARVQKAPADAGVSFRPHPAGGAIHELEVYPMVHRCRGLDAGLYHYDAAAHRLDRLAASQRYLDALLQMAALTAELEGPPQVLLVLTARFQRVQWKYQSMAYALVLKNVGALYQTFYLVATAMGLAPCALGGGHADLFASAAGLDYLAESSVGEFILGSAHE